MAIGVSFLDDNSDEGGGQQPKPNRYQQAIEVLSMRVPKYPRGPLLAPAPLLQGQGGTDLNPSILRAFARMAGLPQQQGSDGAQMWARPHGQGPQMGSGAPAMGMTPPAPRIVPGIDTLGAPAPQGPAQREWQGPQMPQMPQTPPPLPMATPNPTDAVPRIAELFRRKSPPTDRMF